MQLPAWANNRPDDRIDGSRWCLAECRYRERNTHSDKGPEETSQAYQAALAGSGWLAWKPAKCPETPVDGSYTCWTRDELTLDLWVRTPACANVPIGMDPTEGPGAPPPVGLDPKDCKGSDVSIKVRNAVGDERTRPVPNVDPSSVGETPYGLEPTTAPS
jgi:integrin beta 3